MHTCVHNHTRSHVHLCVITPATHTALHVHRVHRVCIHKYHTCTCAHTHTHTPCICPHTRLYTLYMPHRCKHVRLYTDAPHVSTRILQFTLTCITSHMPTPTPRTHGRMHPPRRTHVQSNRAHECSHTPTPHITSHMHRRTQTTGLRHASVLMPSHTGTRNHTRPQLTCRGTHTCVVHILPHARLAPRSMRACGRAHMHRPAPPGRL